MSELKMSTSESLLSQSEGSVSSASTEEVLIIFVGRALNK